MLASAPALACDPALQAVIAEHPERSDDRDALARSCARAGRPADALLHYDVLLQVDANNPDWLLGMSQALIALQRPREALPLLERGRAIAPAYEDIWHANVNSLEAAGEPEEARALARQAEQAFPQAAWPRDKQAAITRRLLLEEGTRLSVALSHEDLSGGRPSWNGATIDIEQPLEGSLRLLAGLHVEERFDTQDEQFSLGLVDRIGKNWSWGINADAAANAEILPEWSLTAEVGRMIGRKASFGLRARHAEYQSVNVDTLAATIEQYAEWFRVVYTLTGSRPTDIDWKFGHVLRIAHDYEYGSHVTFGIGYGQEAETVAPGVVQVTDVKSVTLNGVHWKSAAWGFAWEAGWHEQGDLYDRIRVRLGLEHRF
ncbi:MAG: YaiO family outer membrane beta-barrel protein [Steroidobacteraceae bacterium]